MKLFRNLAVTLAAAAAVFAFSACMNEPSVLTVTGSGFNANHSAGDTVTVNVIDANLAQSSPLTAKVAQNSTTIDNNGGFYINFGAILENGVLYAVNGAVDNDSSLVGCTVGDDAWNIDAATGLLGFQSDLLADDILHSTPDPAICLSFQ